MDDSSIRTNTTKGNKTKMNSRYFHARLFRTLLCSIVIFVLAAPAAAQSTQSATFTNFTYPILGNTHVAADLNGDGRLDLAGSGLNSAAVMLNNGNGTFQPKVQYPVDGQTQDVAAGDFNSDGRLDLVVTINTPQISLSLLLGNGNGTFNAAVNFPNTSGFDSPDVIATDLNNDGKLDVVILHSIACFTAPCIAAENDYGDARQRRWHVSDARTRRAPTYACNDGRRF